MSEFKTISSNDSNSSSYPVMTKEIVLEILESPAPYKNDEERNVCQRMVEALVPDEQDAAACTSYAYWFAKTFFSDQEKPSGDIQLRMAMREARRHLVGSANDEKAALERFRLACQSRLEHNIDLFRSCYPITVPADYQQPHFTTEEEEIKAIIRARLESELSTKQPFFVRGHDKEHRAVVVKMGRQSPETDHDAFVTTHLYVAERVIACSEFLSRGRQEKVVAVMDFDGYSSSNAPPIMTLKKSLELLQSNYPERLKTAVITEPAFWMKALYNVIYPIMSIDTREKIQMAYGKAKREIICAHLEPNQAMPFMMPDGKLESSFDAEVFLKTVPFYTPYQ